MHKNIPLIYWSSFFVDFRFFNPIAIIYFAQITGSFALGMLVYGVANIAQAVFEIPTGIYSDFIGRRKTAILATVAATSSVTFYALGGSIWILLIGGVLEGLSQSLNSGNSDAMLHESLEENQKQDDYPKHYGKRISMSQIGLASSGLIGGFIAYYSFNLTLWLSVIPQLICVLIAFKYSEPKIKKDQTTNIYSHLIDSIKLFIKNPKLRLLSLSSILSYSLGETSWLFRPAFNASVLPTWALGIPQTLSCFGAAFGSFFAGNVIKRFGATKSLFFGSIYSKAINIFSLIFVSPLSPIVMSLASPMHGIEWSAKSTLFQKEFTRDQRATMGSLNSFAGSIAFAVMAYLIGFLADQFSPANSLLIILLISSVNLIIYWKLFKNH